MDIINGYKYYDSGHLIYDVWVIIVVLFLCALISQLVNKVNRDSKMVRWKSSDYVELIVSVGLVLLLTNICSLLTKCIIVLATIIILFVTQQKRRTYITILISLLLGFGLTIVPITLAIFYVLFQRYKRQYNKA